MNNLYDFTEDEYNTQNLSNCLRMPPPRYEVLHAPRVWTSLAQNLKSSDPVIVPELEQILLLNYLPGHTDV